MAVPPPARDRPQRGPSTRDDRGSATAELACSLPALALLVLAGLTAVAAVRSQLECVDAAREAARAVARGEAAPDLPPGAIVTYGREDDAVRATVSVHHEPLGPHLPGFDVSATAVAADEPDASGEPAGVSGGPADGSGGVP